MGKSGACPEIVTTNDDETWSYAWVDARGDRYEGSGYATEDEALEACLMMIIDVERLEKGDLR